MKFLLFTALLLCVSLDALPAIFDSDPRIEDVQMHAIRYADLSPESSQLWLKRMHNSAWLPQFEAAYVRDDDSGSSLRDKIGDDNVRYQRNFATNKFQMKVKWQLDQLVFHPDEMRLYQHTLRVGQERNKLIENISGLYYLRRKVQLNLQADHFENVLRKNESEIQLQELTASLAGLTGGWFKDALKH